MKTTGKSLPFPLKSFHPYWEAFHFHNGDWFPSTLENGSHYNWEMLHVPTGKSFSFPLGNISHSSKKTFPIQLGNIFFYYWEMLPIRNNFQFLLQRRNSSQKGWKRETFPGWLSTNYEKNASPKNILVQKNVGPKIYFCPRIF